LAADQMKTSPSSLSGNKLPQAGLTSNRRRTKKGRDGHPVAAPKIV